MKTFFTAGGHYIIALAIIGALSALMAIGVVTASVGVPVVSSTAALVIGGKLGSTVPTPPA